MSVTYRPFDFHAEDIKPLFDLMEKTYAVPVSQARWKWEYLQNPRSPEIRVFVAESGGRVIASTTRLPLPMRVGADRFDAFFSVDSVVDPAFRRMGIMTGLYRHTARIMPVLYSKGTNPGMYDLLIKFGYRVVQPNTYMVNYLAPVKYLLGKLKLYAPPKPSPMAVDPSEEILPVKRFGTEFDEFWERVAKLYTGIVVKDSAYMNWRYVDIPHMEYQPFYRTVRDKIVSTLVLRGNGTAGFIVDVLWDPEEAAEPSKTIEFAKRYFKKRGFNKLSCWGTHEKLRQSLKESFFHDIGGTLRFSVYADPQRIDRFADGRLIHFVDGDGDSEFCG